MTRTYRPDTSPDSSDLSENRDNSLRNADRYGRIYEIVRMIPRGRVATYGQIAAIEGSSTARMVGYALAALPDSRRAVPWQRVVNRAGAVSERSGGGTSAQRRSLEAEGVLFDMAGCIDFDTAGWDGPGIDWLERHGFHPAPRPSPRASRRRGPPRRVRATMAAR